MPRFLFLVSHDHRLKMGEEGVPQRREVDMGNEEGSNDIGYDYVERIDGPHPPQHLYNGMKSPQIPKENPRYYLKGDEDKHDAEVGGLLQGVKFGLPGGFKRRGIAEEYTAKIISGLRRYTDGEILTCRDILLSQLPGQHIEAKPEHVIEQHDEAEDIMDVYRSFEAPKPRDHIGKSQPQPGQHQEDDGKGMDPVPNPYHQRM